MGTTTTNLKLNVPAFDQIPWDQNVNSNWYVLDAAVGTVTGIPNLAGAWKNSTSYVVGQSVIDTADSSIWQCAVGHTSSAAPVLFAADRVTHPSYWTLNAQGITTYAAQTSAVNVGRNKIHNPLFNIAQRALGPWTANGYTVDRWTIGANNDTFTVNLVAVADSSRAVIGDEEAEWCISIAVTGNSAAASFSYFTQRIEDVRRLSGKTVTVSFYAEASTPLRLGVSLDQVFGTGGSPSAAVYGIGQSVILTGSFARYSLTFTLPSVAGKTFGTNHDHYTELLFWLSCGSTYTTISGGVGPQIGTIYLWGVQLEVAASASALEKPDQQQDLAKCQRFYQVGTIVNFGYQVAGSAFATSQSLPVPMRASPGVNWSITSINNVTSPSINDIDASTVQIQGIATGTGAYGLDMSFTASAEL